MSDETFDGTPQSGFLAVAEPQGRSIVSSSVEETLKQIEIAFKRAERMTTLALSRTRPGDWIDIGGKPYLQASGAVKMLHPFGISVSEPIFTEEQKPEGKREQPEQIFNCKVTFTLPNGQQFHEIGSAASSDDFFCKRKRNLLDSNGKPIPITNDKGEVQKDKWGRIQYEFEEYFLPVSEIDLQDVRKKSYANALGRGVRRMLALENLTWDDLAKAGIKRAGGSYDFKKGGQAPTQDADKGNDRKRQEIREMILEMAGGDDATAKTILESLTFYQGKGLKSVNDITDKALNVNHQKARAALEAFAKNGGNLDEAIKAGIAAVSK